MLDMETIITRVNSQQMSDFNRDVIFQYIDTLNLRNAKYSTIANSVELLIFVERLIKKDFNQLNVQDIAQFTRDLDTYVRISPKGQGKQGKLSDSSKQQRRLILKSVLNMLKMYELADTIKIRNFHSQKLPESILSDEDVENMLRYTTSHKDTAIVTVLYESGCRIGELLTVQLKHLTFLQSKDGEIARMRVDGKTGARFITLINSVGVLHRWLDQHPYAKDPEAPLWVLDHKDSKGKYHQMTQVVLRTLLDDLAKKAGITKRVNPHAFRHARATRLAGYLTESQLKKAMGWAPNSTVCSVYIHLSGRDVEDAVLKMHEDTHANIPAKPTLSGAKWCSECGTQLSPTAKFCSGCGTPIQQT